MLDMKAISVKVILLVAAIVIAASCSSGEDKQALTNDETLQAPGPDENFMMADGDSIWLKADEMPVFPGGDAALLKFVRDNAVYPEVAREQGIEGRVIVRFCVNSHGYVDHVSVLKKVSPELDEESIRVVSALPQFEKTGMIKGKPVSVWYIVPVTFSLK
jgi:protein TonB